MKKTLSVFLAVLMLFGLSAFFMSASAAAPYEVKVELPANKVYGEDFWLVDLDGNAVDGVIDPLNSSIFTISGFEEDERFIFNIALHEKYDPRYAVPMIDGAPVQYFDIYEAFSVLMDKNQTILCPEAEGDNFRVKAFSVYKPYGEGYIVRPANSNPVNVDNLVYWGGNYSFKVVLEDGYGGSFNYEEPELSRMIVTVSTESEKTLTVGDGNLEIVKIVTKNNYNNKGKYSDSYGAYDLVVTEVHYQISDMKENMSVTVSGVISDETVNIFTWLIKIFNLLIALIFGGTGI